MPQGHMPSVNQVFLQPQPATLMRQPHPNANVNPGAVGGPAQCDDDQAVLTGNCDVCDENFDKTDLFRCLTCHSAKNDQEEVCQNSDGSMIYETFCENCIVGPHLRQKHEIIDYKGYTPAICIKHKMLSRFFCKNWEMVFCSSCVIVHKNHDFMSVSEKCTETRRQIFDYLGKLDLAMKPVKHQEDVVQKSMEEIEKFSDVFTEENVTNSLSDVSKRVIENNVSEWLEWVSRESFKEKMGISVSSTEDSKLAVEAARENESFVESLRSLLQKSDGICVQAFLDMQKTVEASLQKQKTTLQRHFHLEWCQNVEEIVKSLIRDFFGRIKSPEMMSTAYKNVRLTSENLERTVNHVDWNEINYESANYFCSIDFGLSELLSVTYGLGSVEFSILCNKNPGDKQNLTIAAYNFHNCTAKKIIKNKSFIAFLLPDQLVRIYCLKRNSFIHELNLPEVLEPLDFYLKADGSFVFFAWNNSKPGIEMFNYAGKSPFFNCESKPKLFKNFVSVSVIVYPNNDVVVYNWLKNIKIQICKLHHGLSQIDQVTMEEKSLNLSDYRLGISLEGRIDFAFPNVSFRLTEVVDIKPQGSIFDCIVSFGTKYYVISDGNFFVGKAEDNKYVKNLPNLTNLSATTADSIGPRKCDELASSSKVNSQLAQSQLMKAMEFENRREVQLTLFNYETRIETEITLFPLQGGKVIDILYEAAKKLDIKLYRQPCGGANNTNAASGEGGRASTPTMLASGSPMGQPMMRDLLGKVRLVELVNYKCNSIMDPHVPLEQIITMINQHGRHLRIDFRFPEDQQSTASNQMLVGVAHYSKEIFNCFGTPFYLLCTSCETFGSIRDRICKFLELNEKDIKKVEFTLVNQSQPTAVSPFQSKEEIMIASSKVLSQKLLPRCMNSAVFLGLDHSK